MFGVQRLVAVFEKFGVLPTAEICASILEQIRGYMTSQKDDMTLVVDRYQGP